MELGRDQNPPQKIHPNVGKPGCVRVRQRFCISESLRFFSARFHQLMVVIDDVDNGCVDPTAHHINKRTIFLIQLKREK